MQNKKSAIMKAAIDLIAEKGFHGTAMSMIVKQSKTSAGIIYHYFSGKEDLIKCIYHDIKAELGEYIMRHFPHKKPIKDQFRQMWLNVFTYHLNHPQKTAFLEQYVNSPYAKEIQSEHHTENAKVLMSMVQEGIQRGTIRDLPLEILNDLTFGVALVLAKKYQMGLISLNDSLIDAVIEGCWKAIVI